MAGKMAEEIHQQQKLNGCEESTIIHPLADLHEKKEEDDDGHHQFRFH
jgi:hypothetical protein